MFVSFHSNYNYDYWDIFSIKGLLDVRGKSLFEIFIKQNAQDKLSSFIALSIPMSLKNMKTILSCAFCSVSPLEL